LQAQPEDLMMIVQPVIAFAWNAAVGIPLLIVGLIVLALIWLFGQPKKEQGKRRVAPVPHQSERREPTFSAEQIAESEAGFSEFNAVRRQGSGDQQAAQGELEIGMREELERLGATLAGEKHAPAAAAPKHKLTAQVSSIVDALRAPSSGNDASKIVEKTPPAPVDTVGEGKKLAMPPRSDLGRRPTQLTVERIVTLFVMARDGEHFHGSDLVVAAEKAGLEFGDMGIYHRLLDGKRELGPLFSVANMLKPGNFDLGRLDALRTPGVSFFMTLPGPLPALDGWDTMLPTAQRLAELLDGLVLDEERNALGRQGIAHIRDQLRGWDRDHEGTEIIFGK
jgi:cell division protein ZipA